MSTFEEENDEFYDEEERTYDRLPWSIPRKNVTDDITITTTLKRGEGMSNLYLEGTEIYWRDYVEGNLVLNVLEKYGENAFELEELSDKCHDELAQTIADVFNYAYAKGRMNGLRDGMLAWDAFLNFPLDDTAQFKEGAYDIVDNALARYADISEGTDFAESAWVKHDEPIVEKNVVETLCYENYINWRICIHLLRRFLTICKTRMAQKRINERDNSSKNKYNRKWFFVSILRLFADAIPMGDVEASKRAQKLFQDLGHALMQREKMIDAHEFSDEEWLDTLDEISEKEFEAYRTGIPVDDIICE